jgi:hypothetical protein
MRSVQLVLLLLLVGMFGSAQSNPLTPAEQLGRIAASGPWIVEGAAPLSAPPATFAKPVLYSTAGSSANALVVTDVNGDSKLDVVATNGVGVAVLLGNGDGTLQSAVTYNASASSLAVADVNGDGKPDVVVNGSNVGVLLGNGDGTFQPEIASNTGGIALAVADVNRDGHLDAVVTTSLGIAVLFGNGNGTFKPPVTTATVASDTLAVADLNNDGKPDAVIVLDSGDSGPHSRTDGTIGVLFGNGNGTFQSPVSYGSSGFYPQQIVTADMNPDGVADDILVVNRLGHVNAQEGSVDVLRNNGGGTFSGSLVRTDGRSDFAVAADDLNGDGIPDLAVVESYNISVVLTGGQFRHHGLFFPKKVAIADLNGDDQPDLIASSCLILDLNCTSDGAIAVLLSTPAPTKTILTTSGSPSQLNQTVTFTDTITSTRGPVPDGQIIAFFDGKKQIATATTVNSVTSITTSSLAVGTHSIKAKFPGCPFFKRSVGMVQQIVNP